MRPRLLLATVLLVAGCGGAEGAGARADTAAPPAASDTPTRSSAPSSTSGTSTAAGEPIATTDLGELPAPGTLAALQRRSVGLPEVVHGAGRAAGAAEQIRYVREGVEFGIDVSEIADLGPDITTAEDAFTALRSQMADPTACAAPPSWCLRGVSGDQRIVVWGHDDAPLVYAALAPEDVTLQALLDAWQR